MIEYDGSCHLLPLRDFHDGVLAARVGHDVFELRRHRVVDPRIAALRAYERRDASHDDDAGREIDRERGVSGMLRTAAQWAVPVIFAHRAFLLVLKSASKCSGSGRYAVMT